MSSVVAGPFAGLPEHQWLPPSEGSNIDLAVDRFLKEAEALDASSLESMVSEMSSKMREMDEVQQQRAELVMEVLAGLKHDVAALTGGHGARRREE